MDRRAQARGRRRRHRAPDGAVTEYVAVRDGSYVSGDVDLGAGLGNYKVGALIRDLPARRGQPQPARPGAVHRQRRPVPRVHLPGDRPLAADRDRRSTARPRSGTSARGSRDGRLRRSQEPPAPRHAAVDPPRARGQEPAARRHPVDHREDGPGVPGHLRLLRQLDGRPADVHHRAGGSGRSRPGARMGRRARRAAVRSPVRGPGCGRAGAQARRAPARLGQHVRRPRGRAAHPLPAGSVGADAVVATGAGHRGPVVGGAAGRPGEPAALPHPRALRRSGRLRRDAGRAALHARARLPAGVPGHRDPVPGAHADRALRLPDRRDRAARGPGGPDLPGRVQGPGRRPRGGLRPRRGREAGRRPAGGVGRAGVRRRRTGAARHAAVVARAVGRGRAGPRRPAGHLGRDGPRAVARRTRWAS